MNEHSSPPNDQELEDYLAGNHPVSRKYSEQSDNEKPDAALDAAILHQARNAVSPRQPRWIRPVAAAAMLVLCFGIIFRVSLDPEYGTNRPDTFSAPAGAEAGRTGKELSESTGKQNKQEAEEKPSPALRERRATMEPAPTPKPQSARPADQPAAAAGFTQTPATAGDDRYRGNMPAESMLQDQAAPAPEQDAAGERRRWQQGEAAPERKDVNRSEKASAGIASAPQALSEDEDNTRNFFAEMRKLIAEGKTEQARELLQRWREDYPGTVLPDDLKKWEAETETSQ